MHRFETSFEPSHLAYRQQSSLFTCKHQFHKVFIVKTWYRDVNNVHPQSEQSCSPLSSVLFHSSYGQVVCEGIDKDCPSNIKAPSWLDFILGTVTIETPKLKSFNYAGLRKGSSDTKKTCSCDDTYSSAAIAAIEAAYS
jgi:hypothetical protein